MINYFTRVNRNFNSHLFVVLRVRGVWALGSNESPEMCTLTQPSKLAFSLQP